MLEKRRPSPLGPIPILWIRIRLLYSQDRIGSTGLLRIWMSHEYSSRYISVKSRVHQQCKCLPQEGKCPPYYYSVISRSTNSDHAGKAKCTLLEKGGSSISRSSVQKSNDGNGVEFMRYNNLIGINKANSDRLWSKFAFLEQETFNDCSSCTSTWRAVVGYISQRDIY